MLRFRLRHFTCLPLVLAATPSAPMLKAQTDSAGIPVITVQAPLWGPGEGWTIGDEPLVEIGEAYGAPEHLLDGVVGAVRLSGGDIVIGERTTGELRRYDGNGTMVWSAGGQGEGPGEHGFLAFLGWLPGDSLITYDHGLLRMQVFGSDGRVARSIRVEMPGSGFVPRDIVAVSERHLVVTFQRPPRRSAATWSREVAGSADRDPFPR